MPALSPTMEAGTLSEWNVKEGDLFSAGDSIAKIETDKATIDFEAQDDAYVAKLLIDAGSEDVKVGAPIMVTVEEEDDVAAFANFTAPETVQEEPAPAVEEAAAAAAPPTPPPVEPTPPPPVVSTTEAPPPPPVETPAAPAPVQQVAPTMGPAWGNMARTASPIAKTLAAQQQEYVDMYGTTGQVPL